MEILLAEAATTMRPAPAIVKAKNWLLSGLGGVYSPSKEIKPMDTIELRTYNISGNLREMKTFATLAIECDMWVGKESQD